MGIDRRALTLPAFVTSLIPSCGPPAMASCDCGLRRATVTAGCCEALVHSEEQC
jgi:hypothetical protein